MKCLLFLALPAISFLPVNAPSANPLKSGLSASLASVNNHSEKPSGLSLSPEQRKGNMSVIEFKTQQYCRAELPADFEFDARFSVVGATVYFTGANFPQVQIAHITSSSLKSLEVFKSRCTAGTTVIFDDVKVIGPDKEVRTIRGVSYLLF